MSKSSISPRVKFGLLGAAVIGGLIAIANMNSTEPAHPPGDPAEAATAPGQQDPPPAAPGQQDPASTTTDQQNQPSATSKDRREASETIAWTTSLSDAMAEAKKSHKLIMVDVFADWCEYCKFMDGSVHSDQFPATFKDSEVVAEAKKFVAVKANATNDHTLEIRYGIHGFPTVLWLDSGGELVSSSDGYAFPGYFVALMKQAQSKYAEESGA